MQALLRMLTFGLVLTIGSVSIGSLSAQSSDSVAPVKSWQEIGTWKLNIALSKFSGPPPKSHMRTFEDRGDGVLIFINEQIDAEGKPVFASYGVSYTVKVDGKDYPMGVNPKTGARLTVAVKIVDPYTVEFTTKADGKVTGRGSRHVSKDGKTLTYKNAEGQQTLVFDRQ